MANNKESENKFTKEKHRYYRDIINPITSKIQEALILYKLKTHNEGRLLVKCLRTMAPNN